MLYEVSYESTRGSGTRLIRADSPEEAVQRFRSDWSLYGDEPPSCWISGTWRAV